MDRTMIEGIYPLSPLQQGMLFHTLYDPASGMYFEQFSFSMRGTLDAAAWERAWERVVERHAVFRTAFSWERREKPLQVVLKQRGEIPWTHEDWRGLSEAEQRGRLDDFLRADRARGFELNRPPLMRTALFRTADDAWEFVWSHHHILLDGWSVSRVFDDLVAFYDAAREGRDLHLPHVRPYRDYIAWLQKQDLGAAEAFWRDTLQGFTTPTPLPVARQAQAGATGSGGEERTTLSRETTDALQALARRERVTPNTLVQGAWALLLSRYSGEEDVVFGATVSGRPAELPGVEEMVGLFINTLPVRVHVHDHEPVLPWLREIQARQAEFREFQHTPLASVQGWSEVPAGEPLFESIVVFENYPVDRSAGEEDKEALRVTEVRGIERTNYPLTLVALPAERLVLRVMYDPRRFDREAIHRLLGHLGTVLEEILTNPARTLGELAILREEERAELLAAGRQERGWPVERTLHETFSARAARSPGAVALTYQGESLTYAELEARSNQLAHLLRGMGVGPEVRVGLCLERGVEMVVSILAVLKAGGAYVPLDPEYPSERLAFLLEDSAVPVLLTHERLLERLPGHAAEVVCVDRDHDRISAHATDLPGSGATPESLAYVIYTSGSTGQPKGVEVTHANVVRLFTATEEWFGFGAEDVWTLFHSYAFDFSVWELWGALLHGGRLVVVPYLTSRSPEEFHRLLVSERVTVLNQTPSAFRQLIQADQTPPPLALPSLSLRYVIFGGEALEPGSLREWVQRHGDERPRLVNMYGITETTVHVTYRPITRQDVEAGSTSPIGRPLPDLSLYLLDRRQQPVPLGVAGELYVGGAGMARGYLDRPELTAERFVRDPFSGDPGARLYRSGDLARRLPGGEIEYLGRADEQVKIRGFRIELGEIEAVLGQHPSVRECVVVAREDVPGERRLAAYVVAAEEVTAGALRAHLKERLPEHMVPAAFVVLESIPLTAHGKVDRRALPAPDGARPRVGEAYVAPGTPQEQALAEIWAQVLGVERVGAHDNFFELGGDSIRSIRVLSLAREAGLGLTLQQLFEHQTVRETARALSGSVDEAPAEEAGGPFSLLTPDDRAKLPAGVEDAYPLTRLQHGMIFHSELDPESAVYHDIFTYHVRARFDLAALRTALERLLARHPVLRTSVRLAGFSEPLQLVHRSVEPPLEFEEMGHLPAAEVDARAAAWMEEEKRRPFVWERAPLMRFSVYGRGEDGFQLNMSCHHAILDGWSVASFTTELFHLYGIALGADPRPLPAPPALPYRRYVELERQALGSPAAREFWEARVADGASSLLPRVSGAERGARREVHRHVLDLPAPLADALRALAQEAGVPLKTVLLAAHLRAMGLLTWEREVVTGIATNGRPEEADGERVLGLFLNTLPFRLPLGSGSWRELVRETFRAEQEILPFRRFPLAEIQGLAAGRTLFDTLFNYVHFHVYQGLLENTAVESVSGQTFEETNFPLAVTFSVSPGSGGLHVVLDHDPAEIGDERACAIGGYYLEILEAMAREPGARHDVHSPLPAAERARLLEWSAPEHPAPAEGTVHEAFRAQARRTPGRTALVFGEEALTYAELDARANRLAHFLRARGVGSETRVGVCMERSPEMVVGILAVLKAGGAYVPLDPAYPAERLAYMVREAVPLVLTRAHLRQAVAALGVQAVCVDCQREEIARESAEDPGVEAGPESLAYVIYTSGSTGRPKGTEVPHRAIPGFFRGVEYARFDEEQVLLQHSSTSWDALTLELFPALLAGGKCVLFPGQGSEPAALAREIRRHGVTTLWVPSALFNLVLDTAPDTLAGVRQVMVGGESVSAPHVRRALERFPELRLVNGYGPSECTVFASCYVVPRGFDAPTVPIGSPIGDRRVYVLDRHLELVPEGVPGELYVGGPAVARGYLGRPEMTAERFVPDPFSYEPGARLYRSGDRVCWRADGVLEFVGRVDHQVKVRGFRIEPGEIEAALLEHPGVREGAVVPRSDASGEVRLVAYVAAEGEMPAQEALRAFLHERLPEYMVPGVFVVLETLPLTPNGKVDRRALPTPDFAQAGTGREYVPPRTPTEEALAAIWREVLGVERVGVHDPFPELGGHSLRATQVISRVREHFRAELPLRILFEEPTVEQLARRVDEARQAPAETAAPIARASRQGRRVAVPNQ